MRVISSILFSIVFLLNGCSGDKEKCIKIVNEKSEVILGSSTIYILNYVEYLNEVMDGHPPMFLISGKIIAESNNSKICFSSKHENLFTGVYRINTTAFLANYAGKHIYFESFDDIPSKLVLKNNKSKFSEKSSSNIKLQDINFSTQKR